jgi:hypothetical protein
MPTLKDLKIVDLKRSVWDKDKSEPTKGRYKFTKKVYLKNKDYDDRAVRPRWVFIWNRWEKNNDYLEFKEWESYYDAEAVKVGDDFWPEPLTPKADGSYQFKDAILMKIPLMVWLKKKAEDSARYDQQRKAIQGEFDRLADSHGAKLEMLEDDIIRKVGI